MEGRRRQRAPGARPRPARLPRLARPGAARRGRLRRHLPTGRAPRRLTPATLQSIRATLLPRLLPDADSNGFAQPFAALTLAEVARADRVQPFLSDAERAELVAAATTYLTTAGRLPRLRRERRLAPRRRPRRRPPPAALAQPRARARPARCHPGRGRQPGDAGDGSLLHLRRRRAADGAGVLHRPARRIEQRRVERLVRPARRAAPAAGAGRPRLRSPPTTTSPRSCCRSTPRCGRAARPKCRHRCCRA